MPCATIRKPLPAIGQIYLLTWGFRFWPRIARIVSTCPPCPLLSTSACSANRGEPMTTDVAIYAARRAVLRLLASGPLAGAELRRRVKATHRPGLVYALGELTASGQVVAEAVNGGSRYTLVHAVPERAPEPAVDPRMCTRCRTRRRRATGQYCGHCLAALAHEVQR